MIVLEEDNVNFMWATGLDLLLRRGERHSSRAGDVLVMPTPVMSVYANPMRRVLMDPTRDANPFFHLMESLWMLAGRSDAAFLNCYVKDFGARFGEYPESTHNFIHGAYGQRWRDLSDHDHIDQLDIVVGKLRRNPDDRQAVIQMWDAITHQDLIGDWKDRPCNTHIYLRVRQSEPGVRALFGAQAVLDLTVCCRSNDIVWGAYGANAVHFSVLQEYLAGRIGVAVGKMYQLSNNYHGYLNTLTKQRVDSADLFENWYGMTRFPTTPIGHEWSRWDSDLSRFMSWHDNELWNNQDLVLETYANSWFAHTATPVALANYWFKKGGKEEALGWAQKIDALDWRQACVSWLQRRMK